MFIAAFFGIGTSWKPQMGRVWKGKQAAVPCTEGHWAVANGELRTPRVGLEGAASNMPPSGEAGGRAPSFCVIFATSYINLKLFQNKNVTGKYGLTSVVFHTANLPGGRESSKGQRTSWEAARGARAKFRAVPACTSARAGPSA